ncbi:MAG: TlpA disulfide reductase family protein [Planctomycetota bacterium]
MQQSDRSIPDGTGLADEVSGVAGLPISCRPKRRRRAREFVAVSWATVCLALIAAAFWVEDWRYGLPTERPPGLVAAAPGEQREVPTTLRSLVAGDRPLLLHFFNPSCPCSRFNLDHLRELAQRFEGQVDIVFVIERDPGQPSSTLLELPTFIDDNGALADSFGVYSTPTAVLLDRDLRVVYVGNYAPSRYCVDPSQQLVRIAVEALLGERDDKRVATVPTPPPAYGCPLPSDCVERAILAAGAPR